MNQKRNVILSVLLNLIFVSIASAEAIELFGNDDINKWEVVVGKETMDVKDSELFSVKDGIVHVYPTQKHGDKQPFGGILTKETFSSYKFTVEYKWGEKKFPPRLDAVRDAGILFHVHGKPFIWPNSLECQIQEGDTGDIWIIGSRAATLYNDGSSKYDGKNGKLTYKGSLERRYSSFPRSYSWEKPGWNKVEVIVDGITATFRVNGHVVNEIKDSLYYNLETEAWEPLTSGKILLQAEGAEIFYRNATIEELR